MSALQKRTPGGHRANARAHSKQLQRNYSTLAEALAAHGLTLPDNVEPGRLIRIPGAGKPPSNRAGWLKLFPDGEGAVFGDWSQDVSEVWQSRKPRDDDELERWRKMAEQAQREAEAQRADKAHRAAVTAAQVWAQASEPDGLHGYLVAKNIQPHGIRQQGDDLLIPVNVDNKISSLQRIGADGSKRFMSGGKIRGGHFVIGEPGERLIVCEGYSTGASLYEATGDAVAVAFNAGNLKLVAEGMRHKHPDAQLIVAADDDRNTAGNPGVTKAREAAQAVNGLLATPGRAGDFNDLHIDLGAEAVRQRIEAAKRITPPGAVELDLVDLADLERADLPEPEHIIDKLLPVGVASSLAGHGGSGKTFVALSAAICIVTGRPFLGLDTMRVPVLIYSAEDGAAITRYRIKKIIEADQIPAAEIADHLHVIDATNIDPALFIERTERDDFGSVRRGQTTPAFRALADKAVEVGARLVIIDNASDVFEASENERARVRGFIRALAGLARDIDGAVLLLSHVDKHTAKAGTSSEGYSGSTAWHNSVRSRMFLHGDGLNLTIEHQKANLGPLADDLKMHWHHGVLMAGHTEQSATRESIEVDHRHTAAILRMIDARSERGQYISTSSTAGNAWTVLSALSEFPKIDRRTFWRLVDQAENSGKLIRDSYRDDKRMPKQRFTVTDSGRALMQGVTP